MQELMTKKDAIEYLLYMKHDVQAKSPIDIALDTAIEALKHPTIEAEPVRHGRWIANGKRSVFGDLEYLCSECGRKITANWAVSDPSKYNAFCSGCGARMDLTDTNVGGKGGADNG